MKYIIVLVSIVLVSVAKADRFDCGLYYNLDRISDNVVETKMSEKVLITKTDEATAYLNQKKSNDFEIEVYLPEHQMRVYSQAELSLGKAQISISTWSRESLIDVICKRVE
jgi:hypothetical protein